MEILRTIRQHKRSFLVAAVINTGAILFGFDAGGIGAIIFLHSFQVDFNIAKDPHKAADASGTIVTLLNAGAIVGAFSPIVLSQYLGRRYMLMIAGTLFLLGGVLQTAGQAPSLSMMNAGRTIAGFGVGMISNISPLFMAECAPKQFRGFMMSVFDLYLVVGGIIAYYTVYGCSLHMAPTSAQWRIPLSLQIPLAALIILGAFFLDESPRWLARKGHWVQAAKTLCRLRGTHVEDSAVMEELAEIRAQINEEIADTQGKTIQELFLRVNWQRLAWGTSIAALATSCGHNVILYYAPTVFNQIGYVNQNSTLLASGVILIIKLGSVVIFLLGPVEYFSRRVLIGTGTFGMGMCLFILAALLATNPAHAAIAGSGNFGSAEKTMVAMIYIFQVFYSFSWGPLLWVYLGEIFPNRIRDYGMAPCVAISWGINLLWSKVQPILLLNIGWKTWLIFGSINMLASGLCYFLPETKGNSIEQLDVIFGAVDQQTRRNDIKSALNSEDMVLGQVEHVEASKV